MSPRQRRKRVSDPLWFLRQVYLARLLLPVPPSMRLMFQLASRKKKLLKVVTLAVGRPLRRKEKPLVLGHQVVKLVLQQTRFRPSPEVLQNAFGHLEMYPGTGMSQVRRARKLLLCQLKRHPKVATARTRLSVALVSA